MSGDRLKALLNDARAELNTLVRHVEKSATLSEKTLAALSYSQKRISEKISSALEAPARHLKWRNPESGTWRAVYDGCEISVFKEAGRYYWQVSCSENAAPTSFDEAEDTIITLLGLE